MDRSADLTRELQQTWNTLERKLSADLAESASVPLRPVHVAILRELDPDGAPGQ